TLAELRSLVSLREGRQLTEQIAGAVIGRAGEAARMEAFGTAAENFQAAASPADPCWSRTPPRRPSTTRDLVPGHRGGQRRDPGPLASDHAFRGSRNPSQGDPAMAMNRVS